MRLYRSIFFACIVACMMHLVQSSVVLTDDEYSAILSNVGTNSIQLNTIQSRIQNLTEVTLESNSDAAKASATVPRSCKDIPMSTSGFHLINPQRGFQDPILVYCDQWYEGGGWTVIQHRSDGSVNFMRPWQEFKDGFGPLDGEFWLGLEKVHQMTYGAPHELHVVLEDFHGRRAVAKYSEFAIGSEKEFFKISKLGKYSGNAGDSLTYHKNSRFSTMDKDNDNHSVMNCAHTFSGAWWHDSCHASNLNGLYLKGNTTSYANGMIWEKFTGNYYSLKTSTMMIRSLL